MSPQPPSHPTTFNSTKGNRYPKSHSSAQRRRRSTPSNFTARSPHSADAHKPPSSEDDPPRTSNHRVPRSPVSKKANSKTSHPIAARTKQALLIKLLARHRGASIEELSKAAGWQRHSVRAALSRIINRNLGHSITSQIHERRGRIYHLATKDRP